MLYRIVVFLIAGVLLFSVFMKPDANHLDAPRLPAFQVTDIQGRSVSESVLSNGGLVHFFRSGCGYCLLEHDSWVAFKKNNPGVVIMAVLHRESIEEAVRFFEYHENPYDYVVYDDHDRIWLSMGAKSTPETFVINAQGEIVEHLGYMLPLDFSQLEGLLQESSPVPAV